MGIQHVTYWYELDLVNTSDVESWYLVNRWPHAYQFNVFFVPDDSLSPVQKVELSTKRAFDDRPIEHRFLVAPLHNRIRYKWQTLCPG